MHRQASVHFFYTKFVFYKIKYHLCNPNEKTTGYFKGKKFLHTHAEVAHLVEHDLAKVGVAGSIPVFRSEKNA